MAAQHVNVQCVRRMCPVFATPVYSACDAPCSTRATYSTKAAGSRIPLLGSKIPSVSIHLGIAATHALFSIPHSVGSFPWGAQHPKGCTPRAIRFWHCHLRSVFNLSGGFFIYIGWWVFRLTNTPLSASRPGPVACGPPAPSRGPPRWRRSRPGCAAFCRTP